MEPDHQTYIGLRPKNCPYCRNYQLIANDSGTYTCPNCHITFLLAVCEPPRNHREEIWRDIKGMEGIYQVSSYMRVRSLDRLNRANRRISGKLLATYRKKNEIYCSLRIKNRSKEYNVRKLWLQASGTKE